MIFTLYYMYATFVQWWRLASLKNKLSGTLNSNNALLLCDETVIFDTKKTRSVENLLFRNEGRIGCTVVPKRKINLSSQWALFPKDSRYFPIFFNHNRHMVKGSHIYVLIQAQLESYNQHQADILQIENFGELMAWKVTDHFEAILKTDMDKLACLVNSFSNGDCDINHELKLLKLETVEIDGKPKRIKFERQFSNESTLKYSLAPIHWGQFVADVKDLYSKVRDATKQENDRNFFILSEKSNKKESSALKEDRNRDDREHKRHKREEATTSKHSQERQHAHHKRDRDVKSESKNALEHNHHHKKDREEKAGDKDGDRKRDYVKEKKKEDLEVKESKGKEEIIWNDEKEKIKSSSHKKSENPTEKNNPKPRENPKPSTSTDFKASEKLNKDSRSSSKEKKLVRSSATCDEPNENEKNGSRHYEIEGIEVNDCDYKNSLKNGSRNSQDSRKKQNTASSHDQNPVGLEDDEDFPDFSSPNSTETVVHKNPLKMVKPPNILVYADSRVAKESVKEILSTILNEDKYIIYDLPLTCTNTWFDTTTLVVICGNVEPKLTSLLMKFMLNGGQLLCLCSDLLYSVLHTFTTAEVREHELVRFSYGKWKNVRMMHHIFCYQASPAKKQFSKDSDTSNHSSGSGSSPIAPRTPSAVEIQHGGKDYTIQVQVLGTEETWQTPSLLLATVKGSEGRAVFSQVHLEIDPEEYVDDESKFDALRESDQTRIDILKDILSKHLELDCDNLNLPPQYTPAYFLGRHDLKLNLINESHCIKEYEMTAGEQHILFCGKDDRYDDPSRTFLPILLHACPQNFNTVSYFETLDTKYLGRLVIYSDVLTSTHKMLSSNQLTHGVAVICRHQVSGVGRSKNVWISPAGSASFTLQLHIPLITNLGKALPLLQHIQMVAVVKAVKRLTGNNKDIRLGIKWPNDLYVNGCTKVGGLIVTSTTLGDLASCNIGCGVNLSNSNPTVCINDVIREVNLKTGTRISEITHEKYFAQVFNETEKIITRFQIGDVDYFYDYYYEYWLHNDQIISIATKDGKSQRVKVTGIDDTGFLKVETPDGQKMTVQPDGNSFDMMKGLIYPKNL